MHTFSSSATNAQTLLFKFAAAAFAIGMFNETPLLVREDTNKMAKLNQSWANGTGMNGWDTITIPNR
jgi:hypothetical protein